MPARAVTNRWTIVLLLFVFMIINYADKAVIGLSAPSIMAELHLTNTQFGTLGSSFFFLFAATGVGVGFLANRIPAKWLLLAMALVWAAAQLPMLGTVGFGTLIVSRIVLGAGEGPAFPVVMHAVYKWFEDARRTVPSSIIACGAAFGTGVIAPGIVWIITHYGWHVAFGVLGFVGLVWSACWLGLGAEGSIDDPHLGTPTRVPGHVRYRTLLLSRTALGVFIAGFVAYWAISLNVVWLASYLIKGVGLSPMQAGWLLVLPSLSQIVLAPAIAFASERMIARGTSSRVARGAASGCVVAIAGFAMMGFAHADATPLKLVLIVVAFSVGSVVFTLGSTLIGEISPPAQRGAMLGISNSIHTLAGLAAPVVMGWIVDVGKNSVDGFQTGFTVAGLFIVAGGLIALALINPEADIARFRRQRGIDTSPASGIAGSAPSLS